MARPARTPEGRESQMINMAMQLAEKQLQEGTASTNVIVHFLRLGSIREQLEREKIAKEVELLQAKRESYEEGKQLEALYNEAVQAMQSYRPHDEDV